MICTVIIISESIQNQWNQQDDIVCLSTFLYHVKERNFLLQTSFQWIHKFIKVQPLINGEREFHFVWFVTNYITQFLAFWSGHGQFSFVIWSDSDLVQMLPVFKWRDFGLRAPQQYHTHVWEKLDYCRPVSEMTQLEYKSDPDVLKVFFFSFSSTSCQSWWQLLIRASLSSLIIIYKDQIFLLSFHQYVDDCHILWIDTLG